MQPSPPYALVVDDEPANLSMFELLCRNLFTVLVVRELGRVAEVRASHPIALAIIDHRLTGADTGLALFEELTCRKILLSADAAMAPWAAERGGEILRKPIDFLAAQKCLRALAAALR